MARRKMNFLVDPEQKKNCPHCERYGRDPVQPIFNFRLAEGFIDGLYYICRLCEEQLLKDFRLAQRAAQREKGLQRTLSEMRHATPATIVNLVDGWMGMFGGLEGFLRENMAHYEALAARSPGSPAVLTYLGQIARFAATAQKYRPPERPESEMTDDDLVVEMKIVAKSLGFVEADPLPPDVVDVEPNDDPEQPPE